MSAPVEEGRYEIGKYASQQRSLLLEPQHLVRKCVLVLSEVRFNMHLCVCVCVCVCVFVFVFVCVGVGLV